jgi:hypothetical protein
MSADNYLYVRKRPDGQYGVSMRFASGYYTDEAGDYGEPWPIPDDSYGVFECAEDAIMAAHRAEREKYVVEYGVQIGAGVLDAADAA